MDVQYRKFSGVHDWGWVNTQVPIQRVEDTGGIVAVDLDINETVGACIMDNWTNNSVQCHFMISHPMLLKHGFLQLCFDYMFNECGVKYVYGLVPSNNEKALKLNKHMGFTVKTVMEEAFEDGVDYILMELKHENCKYLEELRAA